MNKLTTILSYKGRLTPFSALRTLRNSGCAALLMLSATLILTGCPDDAGTNDNNGGGTPTEATRVQNALHGTISIDSIVLNWDLPTDTVGLLGVTISEASNAAASLLPPVEVAAEITTYTVTDLEPATAYLFSIATRYSASGKNNSRTVNAMTVSATTVQNAAIDASATTPNSITLTWGNPQDTDGYNGVTITADPSIPEVTVDENTTTATITGLTVGTSYDFTLTTRYSGSQSGSTPITAMTLANPIAVNPIDMDGDTLIDISSLDQLHNIRYNLAGTSYKISDDDAGTLCGISAATACTGYELTQNLDFTTPEHYNSGMVDNNWRPQDGGGTPLSQDNAENATNAGWPPIGSCNGDSSNDEDSDPCRDDNDTPFNATFEGNSFVISNLYARNTNISAGDGIALFGIIDASSTIRNLGITNGALYGSSSDDDSIGGLVGYSRSGSTITNSDVRNSTVDGGAGNDDTVGGLMGWNEGTITTSYTTNITANGRAGDRDYVGGLVGFNSGDIMASYADGNTTADGGTGNDDAVGGLVGFNEDMITAGSRASGTANGGIGNDNVGGLVGRNFSGATITADSHATGTANGGMGNDNVGGLVGLNDTDATIDAGSHATGTANGDEGSDNVGGLVGMNDNTSITNTYATGTADGGTESDNVGGLVGLSSGHIISNSYATGMVNGGAGADSDDVGGLVGETDGSTITDSYYITGTVSGQGGDDNVGALVGLQSGDITTSYAAGDSTADGGEGSDDVGGLVGEQGNNSSISSSYASGTVTGGTGAGGDRVGGLVGLQSAPIIASYATGTADGGGGNDDVGGLVGEQNSRIIASYATGMATGGDGSDNVGGLVGDQNNSIIASYAVGNVGGGIEDDNVGGLVGTSGSDITASYAVGNVDGGDGTDDRVGSLAGNSTGGTIGASYGFGTSTNGETAGVDDSGNRPSAASVASGMGRTGAALLLAPDVNDMTNTAVAAEWNDADFSTLGAWDFGSTTTELPALRYADYDDTDSTGSTYGCGTTGSTYTIPSTVPDGMGMGGTIPVVCGMTLLPGQR